MASLAIVACKSHEEKKAAFIQEVESIEEGFNQLIMEVYADSTLTDIEKNDKVNAAYEEAIAKYIEVNRKAIEKNRDNDIAVQALAYIYGELTNKEILEYVDMLSPQMQQDSSVVKIAEGARKALLTEEGAKFLDFTIEDSDGQSVSFSDYVGKGKYVLVDFWASWCGPCKREIPNIRAAYEIYGPKGLEVLSVAGWDKPEDTVWFGARLSTLSKSLPTSMASEASRRLCSSVRTAPYSRETCAVRASMPNLPNILQNKACQEQDDQQPCFTDSVR